MRRPAFPALTRATVPAAAAALTLLGVSACASGQAAPSGTKQSTNTAAQTPERVTVATNTGDVEVPRNPQRVVALDNTSFETLQAFGITPVAAPKQLLPAQMDAWQNDPDVLDVGTHREPKLEVVSRAKPDLIVGGKRFAKQTPNLAKIAPVVDLAPSPEKPGYVDALKKQTTALGDIFGKQENAKQLNAALDASLARAKGTTTGQSVFLASHNGGKIDNGAGRISSLVEPLNVKDVFATGAAGTSDSVHQDSGLSPETVAAKNPDVMIVMDRDAATAEGGQTATPARATIDGQTAWKNTTFMKNDDVVVLDPQFYVTEGIQAYTSAYDAIAKALGAA